MKRWRREGEKKGEGEGGQSEAHGKQFKPHTPFIIQSKIQLKLYYVIRRVVSLRIYHSQWPTFERATFLPASYTSAAP